MSTLANKHRADRNFNEGDWVYLKLQPYRQITLSNHLFSKISTKYYGPYQILQKIGPVAYKLSLPSHVAIRPTFHVSQLKPCYVIPDRVNHPPVIDVTSTYYVEPQEILDRRMIKRGNKAVPQILVQWSQMSKEQATWENYAVMKLKFPSFLP
ncbi:uncharacterized protein LOC142162744 [Nicotiana tabacum]|uniref:Uncharacterized protein LOC142162744 n=1 Tax=Nicotiana tabacum TaxID=4097 RepID=A0AC58RS39_TOBAC